jgi:hypothetical protein
MFSANHCIELTESPANYVIFLYNKTFDFFTGQLQVPMTPNMEEGVRRFYAKGGCSNLKWLISESHEDAWCHAFGERILDFFSSGGFFAI